MRKERPPYNWEEYSWPFWQTVSLVFFGGMLLTILKGC